LWKRSIVAHAVRVGGNAERFTAKNRFRWESRNNNLIGEFAVVQINRGWDVELCDIDVYG
jgi:hypothetical protein